MPSISDMTRVMQSTFSDVLLGVYNSLSEQNELVPSTVNARCDKCSGDEVDSSLLSNAPVEARVRVL